MRNILRKPGFLLLAVLLLLSACGPAGGSTPTVEPSSPTATPYPALTLDQIRNARYAVHQNETWQTYPLIDGTFQSSPDPAASGYINLSLGETVVFGDLDGDGSEDAVVTLAENYGGTGIFVSLVALRNIEGNPGFIDSYSIDDRPIINGISIEDGKIQANVTVHAPEEPMCCPTQVTLQTFQLTSTGLVLTKFISNPGDSENSITITSPKDGATVTNPVTITGRITVAPFESNLLYRILLPDGTVVVMASLMVDAPDMGAPGTFSLPVNLAEAGISGPVRIEFFDTSMADGSLICLNSINLIFP